MIQILKFTENKLFCYLSFPLAIIAVYTRLRFILKIFVAYFLICITLISYSIFKLQRLSFTLKLKYSGSRQRIKCVQHLKEYLL